MKALIAVMVLLLTTTVLADGPEPAQAGNALDFVLSLNPIFLIVAGVVLFIASHLSKFIAILLIIVGIASLLISLI